MSECIYLVEEAKKNDALPKKVKMPSCMTMQDCFWLIENKLWSSVWYLDISNCKKLDSSILAHPFFAPSLKNEMSVSFPECVKDYKFEVIEKLQPLSDDPVLIRNWLFPKNETILGRDLWLNYLPKLYSGPWQYASVFLIPALNKNVLNLEYQNFWKILDPCSVSLWLYDDNYKKITINYVTEINAYGNGLLNDDNIRSFLNKFPNVKHVCLTGTKVSKDVFERYNINHRLEIVDFIEHVEPDPTLCLTKENALEMYKTTEGVQQQNCQLFIETYMPGKIKFPKSISEFKNFQCTFQNKTWEFNKFVLAKRKSEWKKMMSLTSNTTICNNSSIDLTASLSENIYDILMAHLSNEKTKDCYFPDFSSKGSLQDYLLYIKDFEDILHYAALYDLPDLTKIAILEMSKTLKLLKEKNTVRNLGGHKQAITKTNSLIVNMIAHAKRVGFYYEHAKILDEISYK